MTFKNSISPPKKRQLPFLPFLKVGTDDGASSSKTLPLPENPQVWNLVLVLGHTDGGWLDLIIASLLTLLGATAKREGFMGGLG